MFKRGSREMSDSAKKDAAMQAIEYVKSGIVLGVGTGSTVNFFIDALAPIKSKIEVAVSSSEASTARMKALGIPVSELSDIGMADIYVDGADEIDSNYNMIKGGGGALTREKIVAESSKKFICIVDTSKQVDVLGKFPLPIEVIPMARSLVAKKMIELGGQPQLRQGVKTDNGNIIIDVHNLSIVDPVKMEKEINQIPGVVTCGIFARNKADVLIIGK